MRTRADFPRDHNDGIPRWLHRAGGVSWRILAIVAVVVLFVYAMAKITLVFVAVFLALVVASVLRPVVNLYGRIMPRGLAVTLALLSAFVVIGGLLTFVVTSVAGQWNTLAEQFTSGLGDLVAALQHVGASPEQVEQWTSSEQLNQWWQNALEWLQTNQTSILSTAASQVGSVVEVFAGLALSLFVTIFFLTSGASMWQWFVNQLPARIRPPWIAGAEAGWGTFSGYARGTVLIALSDGILAGVFLSIVGVPLALPLAVLVFIGAFIPLVGAPTAMIIAMIVALAAKGWVAAIVVGLGIALIGQFEGHVLQPLIMGRQVSLHPVVVAVAVTSGTLVAGILGAVIIIPLVAVVWSVYSELHEPDPPTPPQVFARVHERARARRRAASKR